MDSELSSANSMSTRWQPASTQLPPGRSRSLATSSKGPVSAPEVVIAPVLSAAVSVAVVALAEALADALALPLMTGMIIDRVVPRSDYNLLYVCLAAIGGMTVFNLISEIVRAHLLLHLRIALDTRMTLGFLDHMVSLPFSFFQRRSAGDLMSRVDSNGTVREIVTSKSMSAVIDGLFVLLYAAIIFYVSPKLGAITLAMASAEAIVFLCARPTFHRLLAAEAGHDLALLVAAHHRRHLGEPHRPALLVGDDRGPDVVEVLELVAGPDQVARLLLVEAHETVQIAVGEVALELHARRARPLAGHAGCSASSCRRRPSVSQFHQASSIIPSAKRKMT